MTIAEVHLALLQSMIPKRGFPAPGKDRAKTKIQLILSDIAFEAKLETGLQRGFDILPRGENQWLISISPSLAAASMEPASRAMLPAAAFVWS
jgi:hypothetical protein